MFLAFYLILCVLLPKNVFIFYIRILLFLSLFIMTNALFAKSMIELGKYRIYFKNMFSLLHYKMMKIGHLILLIRRFPGWPLLENSTPFNSFTFLRYNNPFFLLEVPLYTHPSAFFITWLTGPCKHC